jgi:hypothetical protein
MAYLRAALVGLGAALLLGAVMGFVEAVNLARRFKNARPGDTFYIYKHDGSTPVRRLSPSNATAHDVGIATGLNCAALFSLLLVPGAVALLFVKRRVSGRPE